MAELGFSSSITGGITIVGEVRSVGFSLSVNQANTTSTASKYAAYVPTSIEPNSIFISVLFDGSSNGEAEKFVDEFKSKTVNTWTIDFPTGTFSAQGFVSTVTVAAPFEGVITMDITISLTGEPTFEGG